MARQCANREHEVPWLNSKDLSAMVSTPDLLRFAPFAVSLAPIQTAPDATPHRVGEPHGIEH
jgi:hypothetical protein